MSTSVRVMGRRLSPEADAFVGEHPVMLRLLDSVRRAAPLDAPVLIQGPTGAGKELVAQRLHTESGRPGGFVAVNVASLPEALAESELFGSARGAFTDAHRDRIGLVEEAAGGTLYLDEAADLPLKLQAKLLRVLEGGAVRQVGGTRDRLVDFRLVLSVQVPIGMLVEDGRWRADFYYRVAGIALAVPGLAEHPSDIPLLIDHFLRRLGRPPLKLNGPGELAAWPWDGNVRELRRAVERAAFVAGLRAVSLDDIDAAVKSLQLPRVGGCDRRFHGRTLRDLEREHITAVLEETGGAVGPAASILGLSRSQVYRRMQALGIAPASRH
jgi:DNA-binding NtrC family response regulator